MEIRIRRALQHESWPSIPFQLNIVDSIIFVFVDKDLAQLTRGNIRQYQAYEHDTKNRNRLSRGSSDKLSI